MTEPAATPSPLGLFIQPACLQHKYIRHPNSSHIFERPERLRAVLLGVAAAVARLEEAEERVRATLQAQGGLAGNGNGNGATNGDGDDLSNLLSGLSIQSAFQSPRHLSIVPPPTASSPGQVLLHHPALQLAHSPPSPALLDGQAIPSSTYLRDLHKWASEAIETIKQTGCEIPSGLGLNQGDLYLAPGSVLAIEGAIQTVCQAVDQVCTYKPAPPAPAKQEPSTPPEHGQTTQSPDLKPFNKAFCAIRPPGHHCGEDTPSGFCYVNNVVVGALHAYLRHDVERAIIIDFDLHHGNGTQALVMPLNEASHAEDIAVKAGKPPSGVIGKDGRRRKGWKGFYGSVHDIYSYPCEDGDLDLVKDASLSLAAHGQYIENIHLQPYSSEEDFYERIYPKYLALLDKAKSFMDETGAEADRTMILISAGFDACEHEHQGMQRHDRRVPTSFFSRYTKDIVAFANRYTDGKVVSVLEGGYSDRALTSAAMGHAIGMLDQEGTNAWWNERELINFEKASKKKRTGRIAPLASEFSGVPHLVRTHALLGHFETFGVSADAIPASVTSTPQHAGALGSGSGGRMTLRERRKGNGYPYGNDEEVTPPPTASRRGRGTPRGKATAPSTPLARQTVQQSKMSSPINANADDMSTPTPHDVRLNVKAPLPTTPTVDPPTPIPEKPLPHPPATASAAKTLQDDVSKEPKQPKIMLRFARPRPLPPAELASLPSPITPLPPSQSSLYPLLPQLSATSDNLTIEQRLAYREGSSSTATSDDYLSARSIPSDPEAERAQRETSTSSGPHMPGGLHQ